MGRDKALLPVEGQPMALRVAQAARAAGADRIVALGGDPVALRALGLDVRPDDHPGEGPLAALVGALSASGSEVLLVIACDLVAPSPAAMAATVEALRADPTAEVAVPLDRAGRPQWAHAAWRTRAAPTLARAVAAGVRSFAQGAASLAVVPVAGLDPGALLDADRPEDLPVDG